MEKCVYCGALLNNSDQQMVQIHTKSFAVCCKTCQEKTTDYVQKDSRLKGILYLALFFTSIGIIWTTFSQSNPLITNLCLLFSGIFLFLFPYPYIFFEGFEHFALKKAVTACKILGGICAILGLSLSIKHLF